MSVFRHILALLILYSAVLLAPPKMKKVRVNIAPKLGIKDRDVYVDVRFDADNKISINDALSECIQRNCQAVQEVLGKEEGLTGRWRANISVMDRILEHYKGVNEY
jgi:hypothetical protein